MLKTYNKINNNKLQCLKENYLITEALICLAIFSEFILETHLLPMPKETTCTFYNTMVTLPNFHLRALETRIY